MREGYINPCVINDSIMTDKLRTRFCKDVGVNIKCVTDADLFKERLTLCNEKIQKAYVDFVEQVLRLGGEQEFFEYYNTVKESVMNYIKEQPKYNEFISCDINRLYHYPKSDYSGKGVYKEGNDGRKFLSIDLVKGNYTAMRYFSKDLVANTNSYEEFISSFCLKKWWFRVFC